MSILPFDGVRERLIVTPTSGITVDGGYAITGQDGRVIAYTSDLSVAEAIKNIPNMYGAMRFAVGLLDDGLASPEEVDRACNALLKGMAKARGE